MGATPSPEDVEAGLTAWEWDVRVRWAWSNSFKATEAQIDRGMMDVSVQVRAAWACRRFTPNARQIERGLTDPDASVRAAWGRRGDFIPTPAQAERGLRDRAWQVRRAWAERRGFEPTPVQLVRGLHDDSDWVRQTWARKLAAARPATPRSQASAPAPTM